MSGLTRREALTAAVGIGSISIPSVPAVGSDSTPEDLYERVRRLFRISSIQMARAKNTGDITEATRLSRSAKDTRSQAVKLCENNNWEYTIATYSEDSEDGDAITPNDYFVPGNGSRLYLFVYGGFPDIEAQIYWELNESSDWFNGNNTCPPDGAAIYWEQTHWEPESLGRSNFIAPWSSSENTYDGHSVDYGEWDPAHGGVVAEVDDPKPVTFDGKNATFYGGYATKLEALIDNPTSIKAKYTHTWKQLQGCTFDNWDVGLAAGVISITGGDSQNWSMSAKGNI